jgi:hypothetical protein
MNWHWAAMPFIQATKPLFALTKAFIGIMPGILLGITPGGSTQNLLKAVEKRIAKKSTHQRLQVDLKTGLDFEAQAHDRMISTEH